MIKYRGVPRIYWEGGFSAAPQNKIKQNKTSWNLREMAIEILQYSYNFWNSVILNNQIHWLWIIYIT